MPVITKFKGSHPDDLYWSMGGRMPITLRSDEGDIQVLIKSISQWDWKEFKFEGIFVQDSKWFEAWIIVNHHQVGFGSGYFRRLGW